MKRIDMTSEELRGMLRRQPFAPFTLNLADGRAFTIDHPDFLVIPPERSSSVIVFHRGGGFDFVYLKLVTSVTSTGEPPVISGRRDDGSSP